MPINSLDHLMRKSTDGSAYPIDWQFTTNRACTANRWNDATLLNTTPSYSYAATNGALTWVNCNSSSQFALPIGETIDEISGFSKHIIFGSAVTAVGTAVPSVLMLVDLQGYWPEIAISGTQSLSGTPTLRYPNGEGLKVYPVATSTTGTGTPNISLSYTNQAGVSGRSLSHTLPGVASTPFATLYHNAATGAGPFLPLQGNDTGVQNVTSMSFSTSTTGAIALCLVKPLITIPMVTVSSIVERDFVNQFTSLPRIYNGACLTWLYYTGAAAVINSNVYGTLETVWG